MSTAGLAGLGAQGGAIYRGAGSSWRAPRRGRRRQVGLSPELESGSGGRWKADPTGGARMSERENEGARGTGWAVRGEMGRRSALGREIKEQASCRKRKEKKRKEKLGRGMG